MAMTGEISCAAGFAVGGVKEKVLAAARFGIKEVILPEQNKSDCWSAAEVAPGSRSFRRTNRGRPSAGAGGEMRLPSRWLAGCHQRRCGTTNALSDAEIQGRQLADSFAKQVGWKLHQHRRFKN